MGYGVSDFGTATVIAKSLGERLRTAQVLQDRRALSKSYERGPYIEAEIYGAFNHISIGWQTLEYCQSLLEVPKCSPMGGAVGSLCTGVLAIRECLLPILPSKRMIGQPLDIFRRPLSVGLNHLQDPVRAARVGVRAEGFRRLRRGSGHA